MTECELGNLLKRTKKFMAWRYYDEISNFKQIKRKKERKKEQEQLAILLILLLRQQKME